MKKKTKNHASKGGVTPRVIGHNHRTDKQRSALVRMFGDLRVIDAPADMIIMPKQEDIDKAVPADPEHCVFAECCRRSLDSHSVVFFHRYAYVDIPNPKAEGRVVARFTLPRRTRELIEEFDRTGQVDPGGYILRKPTISHQLDAAREYRAELKRKRAAIITGEVEDVSEGRAAKRPNKPITIGVRNGSGRVQFTRKEG